jgi:hypothetical protein
VSTGPDLIPSAEVKERNWLALAIAAGLVLVVAAIVVLAMQHGRSGAKVTPVNAPADPYASSLPISGLAMSESGNLAGGKVTYLDGHIVNKGNRTVSGVTIQVLFRNAAQEVAQNETQQLKIIRMRDPYIDVGPVSAAPLKPGDERDFRLIFDAVVADWDGVYPQLRIVGVDVQ